MHNELLIDVFRLTVLHDTTRRSLSLIDYYGGTVDSMVQWFLR